MIHLLSVLSLISLLPLLVSAHGYVKSVTIDGQSYSGNQPGGPTNPSIIRQVSTISPVKGATNPSINCGMNATFAADVANVSPGSQLLIYWVGGATGDSNWPHKVGPIMHYMAKCSGSCSSYDSTNAKWFLISELGIQPDGTTWYQANIAQSMPANVTIPSNITAGGYLLRSELISLQNAMSPGGAEFYPACIQLDIGGSGTGTPTSNEECTLPGCYSDSDSGILDPTVYDPPLTYTFPGPPVAAFVGSSGSEGGTRPTGATASSSATPTIGSSSPAASASGISTDVSSPLPATIFPPSVPSATPSGNPTTSTPGTTCRVTSSVDQSFTKRGSSKRRTHKRRLIRHGA